MNKLFTWNDYFELGIDLVDGQHRTLVESINEGIQKCLLNQTLDRGYARDLKQFLSDYAAVHFRTEENMMSARKMDERHISEHHQAHMEFTEALVDRFSDENRITESEYLHDSMEYLVGWLANHMLTVDKSFGRQIRSIEAGLSPEAAYGRELQYTEPNTEPLVNALRTLLYLVSQKNEQLERINRDLEHRVNLRTRELEESNRQLEQLSMKDELTKLLNRRYAVADIERLIAAWNRYGAVFSLMFIDVDNFKSVNDQYGHECGDEVLCHISDFLTGNLRKSDIVCRLGGDEFLVICPHSDAEHTMQAGMVLLEKSRKICTGSPPQFQRVSLSIGVTEINQEWKTVSGILDQADKAMYMVKKRGGNNICRI